MAEQPSRNIPLNVVLGLSAVVVLAGGATAWWTLRSTPPNYSDPVTTNQQVQPPAPGTIDQGSEAGQTGTRETDGETSQATEQSVEVYWLETGEDGRIELAARPVTADSTASPQAALEAAIQQLLAGPQGSAYTTTIPQGTELKSLRIEADGVHLDLSQEFTEGGGSASMQGRVAQILYTATSQDPDAQVWLTVEGEPLEVLGGEGLVLDQPLTRQSFDQNFTF